MTRTMTRKINPPTAPARGLAALALFAVLTACADGAAYAPAPEPFITSAADSAEAPASVPASASPPARVRAGVLTAGDIDDTLNLAAFQRYVGQAAKDLRQPRAGLGTPIQLRLVAQGGAPAPGVFMSLRKPGAADAFYSGYSGVDGAITVFPGLYGQRNLTQVELRIFGDGMVRKVATIDIDKVRKTISVPKAPEWKPDFLDLAFVVDTTGSMGDELAWLTRDLTNIVNTARRSAPGVDIRYGLVVYRDEGDAYVVRNFGFTGSQRQMRGWLQAQDANGGGDYPEAAADALQQAAALNWRRGKGERLLFHIADAPPHDRDAGAYLNAARRAAQKDVQIFGLGASGVGPASEFLMRQAAAMTGGRYLFLTDDSGVGQAHAEPTIACYRVTRLTDLMVRVLQSELTGKRVEASRRAILRDVGIYRDGVCQN